MELRFIEQQHPDYVSTRDVIELFNCEDRSLNGNWTVAQIDNESGDVTLIGMGSKSGYITTICLQPEQPEEA